jgi:hypothetical protein
MDRDCQDKEEAMTSAFILTISVHPCLIAFLHFGSHFELSGKAGNNDRGSR